MLVKEVKHLIKIKKPKNYLSTIGKEPGITLAKFNAGDSNTFKIHHILLFLVTGERNDAINPALLIAKNVNLNLSPSSPLHNPNLLLTQPIQIVNH